MFIFYWNHYSVYMWWCFTSPASDHLIYGLWPCIDQGERRITSSLCLYLPVPTCTFLRLPVLTCVYLYLLYMCLAVLTCAYLYLPVLNCTHLYLPVPTCTYLCLPVLTLPTCAYLYSPVSTCAMFQTADNGTFPPPGEHPAQYHQQERTAGEGIRRHARLVLVSIAVSHVITRHQILS